ncbi:hypothetical protein MJO29_007856 [Puccinia striiformis f. sp. tritici]|nr:hypothetical protein MJO29_007856 [Puccinia striiformis f. sp. tritici]
MTRRSNPSPTVDHQPSWVVQKYGGTSLGKYLENVATKILLTTLDAGHRVPIVCLARSGNTKSTGTTNLLLQAKAGPPHPRTCRKYEYLPKNP